MVSTYFLEEMRILIFVIETMAAARSSIRRYSSPAWRQLGSAGNPSLLSVVGPQWRRLNRARITSSVRNSRIGINSNFKET
jgi:hypothetical protein